MVSGAVRSPYHSIHYLAQGEEQGGGLRSFPLAEANVSKLTRLPLQIMNAWVPYRTVPYR
jgi:hypothetical protein